MFPSLTQPRHTIFVELWKGRTDFTGVVESPLISFVQNFNFAEVAKQGFNWDYKIDALTILGYVGQCVAWMRLSWLREPDGGFDGVEYWAKKILLFDSRLEDWYV